MVSNIFFKFSPLKMGEDEPILTSIFFKGVERPPTIDKLPGDSSPKCCQVWQTKIQCQTDLTYPRLWLTSRTHRSVTLVGKNLKAIGESSEKWVKHWNMYQVCNWNMGWSIQIQACNFTCALAMHGLLNAWRLLCFYFSLERTAEKHLIDAWKVILCIWRAPRTSV